jgi:hypothetical protein
MPHASHQGSDEQVGNVVGVPVVVVVPVPVVVVVLVPAIVVVVVVRVAPQFGGVAFDALRHVALPALYAAEHTDRQSLPSLRLGHAALHILTSVASSPLQAFGHRAAGAVEPSSNPTRIATATRIGLTSEEAANGVGHRKMSPPVRSYQTSLGFV